MQKNDFKQLLEKKLDQNDLTEFGSIDEMKVEYKDLVETISEGGYAYTIFELDDDLCVREKIDLLLKDEELHRFKAMIDYQNEIEQIDNKLRNSFLPGFLRPQSKHWWEQGILKEAGPSYVENVKMLYNIDVKYSR